MKPTVRNHTAETRTPSIEKTCYGPPQHSMRGSDPEQTFYGVPQHETDVVVNAEPRESRPSLHRWTLDARWNRTHPRFTSGGAVAEVFP